MDKWHKLLGAQLVEISSIIAKLPAKDQETFEGFLWDISYSYENFDADKSALQKSLEMSSKELFNTNQEMLAQNAKQMEYQQATLRLRSERELILNAISDGIFRLDAQGRTTYANPSALRMVGRESSEVIGMPMHDIIHHSRADGSHYPSIECPIYNSIKSGVVFKSDSEVFWRKDGSSFMVEYTTTPLRDEGKATGAVITFRDITERSSMERKVRDAAHQAGMAEVAVGVLHNIGNVLNSVNVGVDRLIESFRTSPVAGLQKASAMLSQHLPDFLTFYQQDPKAKKLLEYFLESSRQLQERLDSDRNEANELMSRLDLIKSIVRAQQTYAKGQTENKELVDLSEIVDLCLTMQADSIRRDQVRVDKKYEFAPRVSAQRAQLTHVVLNLVKNSIEAMGECEPGSRILTVEIGKSATGGSILKVSDTGLGIEKGLLTKIFSHGFTTKQSGHGFGLHASANMLASIDAHISAASEGPGKGACFTIIFEAQETTKKAS